MEIVYEGVVGACLFELIVNPVPPKKLIELVGESPVVVKEGECATLSVSSCYSSDSASLIRADVPLKNIGRTK